jgi:hypothetical protein
MAKTKKIDVVDLIIQYENGDITGKVFLKLFARLIKTGLAWTLQGHYGRTASQLIDNGYIDRDG